MTRRHAHAEQANAEDDAMFDTSVTAMNKAAKDRLRSFIERVERMNVEIAELQEGRKEIFAEAKGDGFDVAVIKKVVTIRKMDRAKRQELEAILDLYLEVMGDDL